MAKIAITPYVTGAGGVRSFMEKFRQGAAAQGVQTTFDLGEEGLDAILVLAGTRRVDKLWQAHRRGIRIVQRLDGINWIQRRRWAGWRYTLRAEYGNANLAFIRRYLADRVIYQSHFVSEWWQSLYGQLDKPQEVIYNGVDLSRYTPEGLHERPEAHYRIQVVEGSLGGVLSIGLDWAVALANALTTRHRLPVQLHVAGQVNASSRAAAQASCLVPITFTGFRPPEEIPYIDRSAHLFFSAEINAACPNSVIEALACGTPVIGFDTGALKELVGSQAGKVVPYGGNHWKLVVPDIPALAFAATEVLQYLPRYQQAARQRAEAAFDLHTMTAHYLDFLLG